MGETLETSPPAPPAPSPKAGEGEEQLAQVVLGDEARWHTQQEHVGFVDDLKRTRQIQGSGAHRPHTGLKPEAFRRTVDRLPSRIIRSFSPALTDAESKWDWGPTRSGERALARADSKWGWGPTRSGERALARADCKWGWGPTRSGERALARADSGVGPRSRFTRVGAGGWNSPPKQTSDE